VTGWANPVFEPEVAVLLGADIEPGGDREAAAAAIEAIAPAIEMVDLAAPPSDPEAVLAGGFAHRAVLLGPRREGFDLAGLATTVTANGEAFASEDDPERAVGGDILGLVRHAADYLGAFGERLAAGQFLITGSTIAPPPPVQAGQHLVYELAGVGSVEVTLS
jgi:2-keto-4-pentenoate hydratase